MLFIDLYPGLASRSLQQSLANLPSARASDFQRQMNPQIKLMIQYSIQTLHIINLWIECPLGHIMRCEMPSVSRLSPEKAQQKHDELALCASLACDMKKV